MLSDKIELNLPSPIEKVNDSRLNNRGVQLYLKRDDLIHPEIPGNKWRKLKYNLAAARKENQQTLLTFGGAYSNHIRATAAAGSYFGFSTIGIIRGEEHRPLNETLAYAAGQGMQLIYMDRTTYRHKDQPKVITRLHQRFGNFYLIPEGGSNALGVKGCREISEEIDIPFDTICCSSGTGATLAGIAAGLKNDQQALGFSALKGGQFLESEVERLQRAAFEHTTKNWKIEPDFHFGGYAKITSELQGFIDDFKRRHNITLDWVYEAKMMYGLFTLIQQGKLSEGKIITAVIAATS